MMKDFDRMPPHRANPFEGPYQRDTWLDHTSVRAITAVLVVAFLATLVIISTGGL